MIKKKQFPKYTLDGDKLVIGMQVCQNVKRFNPRHNRHEIVTRVGTVIDTQPDHPVNLIIMFDRTRTDFLPIGTFRKTEEYTATVDVNELTYFQGDI